MPVSVKVGGAWKTANNVYTKVAGVWKTASDMPVKVSGAWKTNILSQIITDGLMWSLDARTYTSGTTWLDSSPNGYNFGLNGTYTKKTGYNNAQCIEFPGAYGDFNCAQRNGSITHDIGAAATIEVVYSSISGAQFHGCSRIVSGSNDTSDNVDYSNFWTLASCDTSKHGLWLAASPSGNYATSNVVNANDIWSSMTWSWTRNGPIKIYHNGVLQFSGATAGATFNYLDIRRMTVAMNSNRTIEHCNCRVAWARMYFRQLSDTEVSTNFANTRSIFGI